ncbi:hypothetical protein predicted by Glimmer/Critica [Sorangium cellulosum So ce56]|uniref:Uncharacterized protein n=1 Tax=Sorangium cellulosum (strain So ce56) TaxID=448385 RepID=A9ET45_SORC5|nr:hypothetical protein predicted by Glimmer/Critica [Sorangium cellulosum So ce56]
MARERPSAHQKIALGLPTSPASPLGLFGSIPRRPGRTGGSIALDRMTRRVERERTKTTCALSGRLRSHALPARLQRRFD